MRVVCCGSYRCASSSSWQTRGTGHHQQQHHKKTINTVKISGDVRENGWRGGRHRQTRSSGMPEVGRQAPWRSRGTQHGGKTWNRCASDEKQDKPGGNLSGLHRYGTKHAPHRAQRVAAGVGPVGDGSGVPRVGVLPSDIWRVFAATPNPRPHRSSANNKHTRGCAKQCRHATHATARSTGKPSGQVGISSKCPPHHRYTKRHQKKPTRLLYRKQANDRLAHNPQFCVGRVSDGIAKRTYLKIRRYFEVHIYIWSEHSALR